MPDEQNMKSPNVEQKFSPEYLWLWHRDRDLRFRKFLFDVAVGITVAGLAAIASYSWAMLRAREAVERAPDIYVQELDKLITKGVNEGEANAVLNAKAIVAARNSLASSLSALGMQLDSQIDVLATTVGSDTLLPHGSELSSLTRAKVPLDSPSLNHEAYMQILILQKIWPAKKRQIEIELKKLFAELGLYDRR